MNAIWVMTGWFAGLWLAASAGLAWGWWAAAAGGTLMIVCWLAWRKQPLLMGLVILAMVLGGWRLSAASMPGRLAELQPLLAAAADGERVGIAGVIEQEPERRDDRLTVVVRARELVFESGRVVSVDGRVRVELPRWAEVAYGDLVTVSGVVSRPENGAGDFDYAAFLARRDIYVVMANATLETAEPGHGRWWLRRLLAGKRRAEETIDAILPAPESGLLSGILLGTRHALPEQVEADFQATGITHIVVISGFNISIVAAIFLSVLTPILGRRGAAAGSIAAIVVYTILVGADAAVIRAAIMGSLFVISDRLLGRRSVAVGSLLLAAVLMTVWRPVMLWDAGFQLSFMATLSLMVYADRLTRGVEGRLLRRLTRPAVRQVMGVVNEAVLVTIAAQILTLPLLIYLFGQLSLISLVANALILPAQSGVMLWGGAATGLGVINHQLGWLVGQVAYLFLWYTIRVSRVLAGVPWAMVPVALPLWGLLLFYGLAGGLVWLREQPAERQAVVKRRLREHLTAGLVFGACAMALVWGFRWWATRPDGGLHVVIQSQTDPGGPLVWIRTPSGRQVAVVGDPRPTEITRFLGEHQPLVGREIDLLFAPGDAPSFIAGWPAVLARYPVGRVVPPAGWEAAEGETRAELERLMAGNDVEVVAWSDVDRIEIEDGVEIVPLFGPAGERGSPALVGLGITHGGLRLQLDFVQADGPADRFRENLRIVVAAEGEEGVVRPDYPLQAGGWAEIGVRSDGREVWLAGRLLND